MNWFVSLFVLVGMTGFEPATSWPPAKRATKLRHTPLFFRFNDKHKSTTNLTMRQDCKGYHMV
jgi:hypothetical protein